MSRRAGRAALGLVVALVGLAVASQLVLPAIAERRLRERLERDGEVTRVHVSAFPALRLLDGRAERVEVRMAEARPRGGRLADLLDRTREADEVDAHVDRAQLILLRVRDLRLRKRGERIRGEASVGDADLRAALPPGFAVRPVASGGGRLVFEGTARLLGRTFTGRAVVAARDGRLLLAPDVPFGGFFALTVFEDPRIAVEAVGARPRPGGFTLTASARLA